MDLERVNALLEEWGEPAYRGRQVYEAVVRGLAADYDEITALPRDLRRRLSEAEPLRQLQPAETQLSSDGTFKVRFTTRDGFPVEAVAMQHRNRRTVCVSSQSGCPLACTFCATGSMGLGRNLSSGEISEQVVVLAGMLREGGERVTNVVMMGMGEPFLNYDAVLSACRSLNDPAGYGLGARQIAISTAGWVPGIERLASEPLQVKLALSLHAPNDRLRTELMPVTRRYPVRQLIAACRDYRAATRRRIFVEYLMLDGVNDANSLAVELAALLGRDGFHVNLIAYNPTGSDYRASPPQRVAEFAAILEQRGISASYRRSHGQDIDAACGQLAVKGAAELRRRRRRSRVQPPLAGTLPTAPR
jgi:23S rRNA (adenine2503-C2)-methyltransferase